MNESSKPFLHATQRCDSCGNRLDIHQAVKGNYCADTKCQNAQAVSDVRENEALDRIASDYAQSHFGATTVAARVPSMERHLVKTDSLCLARFRRNLRESIRQAASEDTSTADTQAVAGNTNSSTPDDTSESSVEESTGNRISISCEVCRGNCCEQGADHAFLYPGFIRSRLRKNPALSAVTLYREYRQLLPSHSNQGSCVYHGSSGCALPREMRSDTCNRYECPSRLAFARKLQHTGDAPVAVIAMAGKNVRRAALTRKN